MESRGFGCFHYFSPSQNNTLSAEGGTHLSCAPFYRWKKTLFQDPEIPSDNKATGRMVAKSSLLSAFFNRYSTFFCALESTKCKVLPLTSSNNDHPLWSWRRPFSSFFGHFFLSAVARVNSYYLTKQIFLLFPWAWPASCSGRGMDCGQAVSAYGLPLKAILMLLGCFLRWDQGEQYWEGNVGLLVISTEFRCFYIMMKKIQVM